MKITMLLEKSSYTEIVKIYAKKKLFYGIYFCFIIFFYNFSLLL